MVVYLQERLNGVAGVKIVISDCDHGFVTPERAVIESAGHHLAVHQCSSPGEVIEVARDADGLICQAVPITGEVLRALARCKVVGRYGVGVDNVDLRAATALGIKVVHVPDFCYEEVADHTLALILAMLRGIALCHHRWKRDPAGFYSQWDQRLHWLQGIQRCSELVLGIVGLGRAGQGVARRARGFGFQLLGYDPYISEDQFTNSGVRNCSAEELLRVSDIVTLHVPLAEDTAGFIGEAQLRLMKGSAVLVNTSRGGVVDEPALIAALDERRIAGAALDVTREEPLPPDHPLIAMENVLLTPHVAFYSESSLRDVKERIARYVLNALVGEGDYRLANSQVSSR